MSRLSLNAWDVLRSVFSPWQAFRQELRAAHARKEFFGKTIFVTLPAAIYRAYINSGIKGDVVLAAGVASLSVATYAVESKFFNLPNGGMTSGVTQVDMSNKPVITASMLNMVSDARPMVIKFKFNDGKSTHYGVLVGHPRIVRNGLTKRLVMDAECIADPVKAQNVLQEERKAAQAAIKEAEANPANMDSGNLRQYGATTWALDVSRPQIGPNGETIFHVETNIKSHALSFQGVPHLDVEFVKASLGPVVDPNGVASISIGRGHFLPPEMLANRLGVTVTGARDYKAIEAPGVPEKFGYFVAAHRVTSLGAMVGFMGLAMGSGHKWTRRSPSR